MHMNNQTVLVTGGTDGIGKETTLQLVRMGAQLIVHDRNQKKGAQVIKEINRVTCNKKVNLYAVDFSSLADIKRMAEDIN